MSGCLGDEEILAFVASATPGTKTGAGTPMTRADRAAIQSHLGDCARCRVLVAETKKAVPVDHTIRVGVPVSTHTGLQRQRERAEAEASEFGHRPPPERNAGDRVGRYEIVRLIGRGGAGLVYEAYDPHLSRRVGLKLVRASLGPDGGGSDVDRLLREARAMAQLWHPSVVAVFDAGTYEDGVFIAMELVLGRTLGRWLREDRPEWKTTVDVFIEAGKGLVAAHAAKLVHGDFKPENVLMGSDGRPRVSDFGLARPAEVSEPERVALLQDASSETLAPLRSALMTMTQPGVLAGTPAYMAPEQFRGAHADEATDQFNFSAALYSALYGQLPFGTGRTDEPTLAALARSVLTGSLRPPPSDSKVPAALYQVLARGLSLERASRFASMTELLDALAAASVPADTRAIPPVPRRRSALIMGVSLGIAVAATFAFRLWRPQGESGQHAPATPAPLATASPDVHTRTAVSPLSAPAPAAPEKVPPDVDRPAARRTSSARHSHQAAPSRVRSARRTARAGADGSTRPSGASTGLGNGLKDPYANHGGR